LAERKNNHLLVEHIDLLRECFRYVKQQKPLQINAIVILLDHLHCIWTLPQGDTNYSMRWNMIKGRFSRSIDKGERISASRLNRRERGIYPRAQVATPVLSAFDNQSRRL
jgi:putative transposase